DGIWRPIWIARSRVAPLAPMSPRPASYLKAPPPTSPSTGGAYPPLPSPRSGGVVGAVGLGGAGGPAVPGGVEDHRGHDRPQQVVDDVRAVLADVDRVEPELLVELLLDREHPLDPADFDGLAPRGAAAACGRPRRRLGLGRRHRRRGLVRRHRLVR